MTKQGDLFRPMLAEVYGKQTELWGGEGEESSERCDVCGANLVRTPTGYFTCPRGHGRLIGVVHVPTGGNEQ